MENDTKHLPRKKKKDEKRKRKKETENYDKRGGTFSLSCRIYRPHTSQ